MKKPPRISFLGMERLPALEAAARAELDELERLFPAMRLSCVNVERLHKQPQQGLAYAARIDATVPGLELTVSRISHEGAYVALHAAFDGMRQQIADAEGQRDAGKGGAQRSRPQGGPERLPS